MSGSSISGATPAGRPQETADTGQVPAATHDGGQVSVEQPAQPRAEHRSTLSGEPPPKPPTDRGLARQMPPKPTSTMPSRSPRVELKREHPPAQARAQPQQQPAAAGTPPPKPPRLSRGMPPEGLAAQDPEPSPEDPAEITVDSDLEDSFHSAVSDLEDSFSSALGDPEETPPESTAEDTTVSAAGDTPEATVEATSRDPVRDGVRSEARTPVREAADRTQAKGFNRDVSELFNVLADRKSTPANLAAALGNLTTIANDPSVSAELESQIRQEITAAAGKMKPRQREQLAKRLQGTSISALQREANLGIGLISVNNRGEALRSVRQLSHNIDMLKSVLGAKGTPEKIKAKDLKKARKTVEAYARRADANFVQMEGSVAPDRLQGMTDRLVSGHADLQETAGGAKSLVRQFGEDVADVHIIVEDANGDKEWLTPRHLDIAAEGGGVELGRIESHLANATGRSDPEAMKLLSQLMNRVAAETGSLDNLVSRGGVILATPDGKDITGAEGEARQVFTLKQHDDGSFTLKIAVHQDLESVDTVDFNGEKGKHELNPGRSAFDSETTIRINPDLTYEVEDISCNLSVASSAPTGSPVDATPYAARRIPSHVVAAQLAKQHGIPPERDYFAMGASPQDIGELKDKGGGPAILNNLTVLAEDGLISSEDAEYVETRLVKASAFRNELVRIAERGVDPSVLEDFVGAARDYANDLKLVQQQISLRADVATDHADRGDWKHIGVAFGAASAEIGDIIDQMEDLAAEAEELFDDTRGNLDEICTGALESRAGNARMQSRAACALHVRKLAELEEGQRQGQAGIDTDAYAAQVAALGQRAARIEEMVSGYERDEMPIPEFGPGAKGSELKKLTAEMNRRLDQGLELPLSHPQLSEAQLSDIQMRHFIRSQGFPKEVQNAHFSSLEGDFKREMVDQLSHGDWGEVHNTFRDRGPDGRLRVLSSTITPAPAMACFAAAYGGAGVPSHARTQVEHANNLAHTQLRDADGRTLFSGLRHGIMHATKITPAYLASLGRTEEEEEAQAKAKEVESWNPADRGKKEELRKILTGTLADYRSWDDYYHDAYGSEHFKSVDAQLDILSFPSVAKAFANDVKMGAAVNAARELVQAAVNSDPALRQAALAQGGGDTPPTVYLNSISLVTPSPLKAGSDSETQMQAYQEAALQHLADQPQFPVQVADDEGNLREVKVALSYMPFNFAVNSVGVGDSPLQRVIKPAAAWGQMDETNRASLTHMIGDPGTEGVGGEAERVLAHLEGREHERPLEAAEIAALQGGEPGSAFADPAKRARAIRALSGQVKEIFSSGAHRVAGFDPYKIVSRLALLSHLLGDNTAFNCKSGKDRTGQLDAEVKMLAATLAAGDGANVPDYRERPDAARKTNFLLHTGNLEMQEKNTGLRGFKLKTANRKKGSTVALSQLYGLGKQFNSPLAKALYNGDSRLVKS